MLPLAQPIQTPRLTLRPFSPADFDDLYAYQSRPEVARYLRWHVRDRAQARAALEEQCRETRLEAEGDWLTFAVVWRETGFVFNPDYQGRGLAAEAAAAMLTLAFDRLGWHRVTGSEWTDELVYAILDREWKARQPEG